MADFDAIVVGAGCAGSVAAYELAKAGKEVLLIERGNFAGAKNMTGGRIYAHSPVSYTHLTLPTTERV